MVRSALLYLICLSAYATSATHHSWRHDTQGTERELSGTLGSVSSSSDLFLSDSSDLVRYDSNILDDLYWLLECKSQFLLNLLVLVHRPGKYNAPNAV